MAGPPEFFSSALLLHKFYKQITNDLNRPLLKTFQGYSDRWLVMHCLPDQNPYVIHQVANLFLAVIWRRAYLLEDT